MIPLGGHRAAEAAAVAVHGSLAKAPVAFHGRLLWVAAGLAGLSLSSWGSATSC